MKNDYKKSGVNYEYLDEIKRLAQKEGKSTIKNIKDTLVKEVLESRGESAYLLETKDAYYATVIEGLGTKNRIADEFRKVTKKTYYDSIAKDTVAMIINDLITVGARPLTISAYWATGKSSWWRDKKRAADLIRGWKNACNNSGCTWGGGETPTLSDVINEDAIDLAGSAVGIIEPKERAVFGHKVAVGDSIVFLESNGIHANGLTLIRNLVKNLKQRYESKLSNGKMFGEEILKPTHIYSTCVQAILDSKIEIHYMVNITGHGFRKLMRLKKTVSYIVETLPKENPLFTFIQEKGKISDKEMYSTFNMGVGFAFFVKNTETEKLISIAKKQGFNAWVGGHIEKGPRQVVINPLKIKYRDKDLRIR